MARASELPLSPRSERSLRRGCVARFFSWFSVALALSFWVSSAWAGVHRVSVSRTTSRSADHVIDVLTAYDRTCESGCRYRREGVIRTEKLEYQSSRNRWLTWTHVSTPMREVKYFSVTVLQKTEDGGYLLENRQLDSNDKDLVDELERRTGLDHRPAFEAAYTVTALEPLGNGWVRIHRTVTLVSSGLLSLWPDRIEKEMRQHLETTFRNIES